tara:strand:- start:5835 stop:7823 length:1989 start_codon:yes stop_codon:yes gene_type:complete
MAMTESQLLGIVNQAKNDAVRNQGEYVKQNEKFLRYYLGLPFGDENEGQSQVVSTDAQDVVESDMPSLVRVFLGAQDVLSFKPNGAKDQKEADEKTKYINWIINHQKPSSFKIIHDWMKGALIQKMSAVKFEYVEEEKVREVEFEDLADEEAAELLLEYANDPDIEYEILGQDRDESGIYLKIKYTQQDKFFRVRNIPNEQFIISRNAPSKDEAEIVGDVSYISRGQLISLGYDEDLVRSLPSNSDSDDEQSGLPAIRHKDEGGSDVSEDIQHWASEEIEVYDLYVLVDFDGDGIPERRHIVLAGNKILDNDPFDLVPYGLLSAVLMPNSAIGRSRVELTTQTQRVKSVLYRQMLDNIYRVNGGRVVVNEDVTNIDDLLVQRPNGIVRTSGEPHSAVAQLETPYIGQQALQVLQYVDSTRAQSTGQYLTNQALDSDQLHKETATRFEGIKDAGAAKVELIARNFAETGFRELFEGLAWLVSHFQDSKQEIQVLGKPMTVNPKMWRHTQYIESNVGLAAGDNADTIQNMSGVYAIQQSLLQQGSPLVDSKKIYNSLSRMNEAMGIKGTQLYFNDPEQPDQLLLQQNEQLMGMVEQLQAQVQQNPLAEAEKIAAQAKLIEAQGKSEQKNTDQQIDLLKHKDKMNLEYTKVELDHDVNIPGQGAP